MQAHIDQARIEDVPAILEMLKGVGLCPAPQKLVHYFFTPPQAEYDAGTPGGFVVKDERGGCVGYCGLSPCRVYIGGKGYPAYQMGILGIKQGYGAMMFELMDEVIALSHHALVYANTANKKSLELWTNYAGFSMGPTACSRIQYAIGTPIDFCRGWAERFTTRANVKDFSDPLFRSFWERFRDSCQGVCTSRTPERLNWVFGKALQTGICKLITIADGANILGYAVLRVRPFKRLGLRRYDILDVCVSDGKVETARSLLRACKRYTASHLGIILEYVGGIATLDEVIKNELPHSRPALAVTSFYATRISEVSSALQGKCGWFFGPYDGDRCAL